MSIREHETKALLEFLSKGEGGTILVLGKKKVGKTTFVLQSLREENRNVTYFECRDTCENSNLMLLGEKLGKKARTMDDLFTALAGEDEERVIVLDEAQKLWKIAGRSFIDWILMASTKHKVIIVTSSSNLAKDLGKETIEIKDPDYREAALNFYPDLDDRTKLAFFAVFGSSLFASSLIDPSISIKKNIKNLLLEPNGALRLYIEHELLEDLGKTGYGHTILSALGNRRMRYSEIEMMAGQTNNGLLDKQMKILSDMGAIRRTLPINRQFDRKKALYETEDNLVRFYYTFIYPHKEELSALGSKEFYTKFVQPGLEKYIDSRCQEALRVYFTIQDRKKIEDVGRYLTDQAEWPVVVKDEEGLVFWDIVASGKAKMSQKETEDRMSALPESRARKGIFSLSGFETGGDGIFKLSAKDLYA